MDDNSIYIQIGNISTPKFSAHLPDRDLVPEASIEDLEVSISVLFSKDENLGKKDRGMVQYDIELSILDKETVLLEVYAEFMYVLSNIQQEEGKKFRIPKIVERYLVDNSISTLRGIILSKTKGTILDNFFIPLVNADELLKDMKNKSS